MKINYKNFVSFAMTLQILILLFGIAAIPAAAIPSPDDQFYVRGTVTVDGEPAPLNTPIIAKVDGVLVGSAKVDQVGGKYGYKSLLPITCNSDKYGDIKFYVNNVEAKLSDVNILNDAEAGQVIESVNLIVTSPVVEKENEVTGGGFGGSAPTNDTDSESLSESIPSASTTPLKSVAATQSTDDFVEYEEEVPESETGSPMILLLIGAILFLGIIITVGYKLKEN